MSKQLEGGTTQNHVAQYPNTLPLSAYYSQRHDDDLITVEEGVTTLANRTFNAPDRAIAAEIHAFTGAMVLRHGESDDDVTIADRYIAEGETVPVMVPTGGKIIVNAVDGDALGGSVTFSINWLLAVAPGS